jgi:transcriptional regulator with XRE-family HTH domain
MVVSTGNRIQARREALGWSREDLAQKLETTRMGVWRIENGKVAVTVDVLRKIAKLLRVTPAELVA